MWRLRSRPGQDQARTAGPEPSSHGSPSMCVSVSLPSISSDDPSQPKVHVGHAPCPIPTVRTIALESLFWPPPLAALARAGAYRSRNVPATIPCFCQYSRSKRWEGYSRPQNTPLHHGDPLVVRLLLLCRLEPDVEASVCFWRSGSSSPSSSSPAACRVWPKLRWETEAGAKVPRGRDVARMAVMVRPKSPSCCPKKLQRR